MMPKGDLDPGAEQHRVTMQLLRNESFGASSDSALLCNYLIDEKRFSKVT